MYWSCTRTLFSSSLQSRTFSHLHTLFSSLFLQRPSGKELLKHRFIKNAKKNSCLVDLIDRFRRWKAAGGDSGDDLSDNELERYNSVNMVSCWYTCVYILLHIMSLYVMRMNKPFPLLDIRNFYYGRLQ